MSIRPLAALVLAAAAVAAGPACGAELVPQRSALLRCLTPAQDRPQSIVYPPASLQRLAGGMVRVELSFAAADAPPRVQVVEGAELEPDLVETVRSHVAQYRVPCLSPGAEPARFLQDFVFTPNEGKKVVWSQPRESTPSPEQTCYGHIHPGSLPAWPMRVRESFGKVLLRMQFTAPDRPPGIEVVGSDPEHPFARAAVDWAQGVRVPCMTRPFVAQQVYTFQLEGRAPVALRDMPLTTFLRSARDATAVPVYFDFRTMGCPFELRMKYWQPHGANSVGEVGQAVPARRPFLDWLSGLSLDLKPEQQNLVVGDEFTLTVPCGTLDL